MYTRVLLLLLFMKSRGVVLFMHVIRRYALFIYYECAYFHASLRLCNSQGKTIIVTMDPANVKHILLDRFDNYVKGEEVFTCMKEIFGHGIFGVDGDVSS